MEENNEVALQLHDEEEFVLRRSNREGVPKKQCPCCDVVNSSHEKKLLSNIKEALNGPDAENWKTAKEELKILQI